ncbi:sodium:proline symporter [bacterium]|nr:MAG: sodium:proline symporter [bacterium]
MDPILTGFVVYLVVVLVVGVIAFRQTQSQSAFILGDRKLGPWVIAFSERASGESAWLLVGLPGAALATGFIELWTAIGCTTGILFSWTFVAPRLRESVGRTDSLTLPDFFRQSYPETHEAIRIVASLIITFFFTFYVAAQFNAAGKVLDTTFGEMLGSMQGALTSAGLSLETTTIGMLIGTIIVLFYTAMGGFVAVAWTDVVQGVIMVFTCVCLPIVGWIKLGGNEVLLPRLAENASALSLTGGTSGLEAALLVVGGLSWGLGYMGQPHLLMRYMAIRSTSEIRTSRLIAIWWAVPAFWGAFMIGIVGLAAFGVDHFEDPERLMPFLAQTVMPGWLAGIMISGAIAAMMSTADSQLLVTTSTLSEDVWHKLLKRDSSPQSLARVSRMATIVVGLVAFALAVSTSDLVFSMVSFAWSGLSAAFGPALLLTLWWKRCTGNAVLAGMIGGTVSVVAWRYLGGDALISERVAGFAIALALVVGVSLLEGRRQPLRP